MPEPPLPAHDATPAALGYRMPPEWAPHRATWLSFPHKEASWPGKLPAAQRTFATMVAALARSEPVHINVNNAAMETHARHLLTATGATGDIRFHHFPTNDAWCRDHGAIFLTRSSGERALSRPPLAATDWGYNAWGGKYPPFDLDNRIPAAMAAHLDVPCFHGGMILEGGSIDVNGAGVLLTSESCLLNPNRNPDLDRAAIEQRLRDFLGVHEVVWLGDGIAGDDTDGHIDDMTRFVAADTILTMIETDPADENHAPLRENLERLRALRRPAGARYRIVELPMPGPVVHEDQRLPASYANFYIANRAVLLPVFNHPHDQPARETLAALFPDREIVAIDCTDLIWGLGAFHCLTQQVPA